MCVPCPLVDVSRRSNFIHCAGEFQAIETDPNGPSAHVYYGNRAAARQYLRDFAGAAEDARASITAKPEYLKSYIRLAQACSELKQWDEAISACNKALEIDSTNASVQTLLAKAEQHKVRQRSASILS